MYTLKSIKPLSVKSAVMTKHVHCYTEHRTLRDGAAHKCAVLKQINATASRAIHSHLNMIGPIFLRVYIDPKSNTFKA